MTNAQTILGGILSSYLEQYELPGQAQLVLDRLRERVTTSEDVAMDITSLYAAEYCEDLALGMLWVVERAGNEPTRDTATSEEEQAVHAGVTSALSGLGLIGAEQTEQAVEVQDSPEPVSEGPESPVEESPAFDEAPPALEEPSAEGSAEQAPDSDTLPAGEGGTTDRAEIGRLLEQLLEALQAGEETRTGYMASLRSSFSAVLSDETTEPSLRSYAEAVDDFLTYVHDNDLLDDVRVMNFFTNVQEPYAQWLSTPEDGRDGILEQAIEFLADFRAMFE